MKGYALYFPKRDRFYHEQEWGGDSIFVLTFQDATKWPDQTNAIAQAEYWSKETGYQIQVVSFQLVATIGDGK